MSAVQSVSDAGRLTGCFGCAGDSFHLRGLVSVPSSTQEGEGLAVAVQG